MKKRVILLSLAIMICISGCSESAAKASTDNNIGLWPITNVTVPSGVQKELDSQKSLGTYEVFMHSYVADGDLDLTFPIPNYWLRVKNPDNPNTISLNLYHEDAAFRVDSLVDFKTWASVRSDGKIVTDTDKLKYQAQQYFNSIYLNKSTSEDPIVTIGDPVLLPVGQYTAYAFPFKRNSLYFVCMLWSTEKEVYVGILGAPADEFGFAYSTITEGLKGFQVLSSAKVDELANTPPVFSTLGLLPDFEAYPNPPEVEDWYKVYNASHHIEGKKITAKIYASKLNDMTIAVPSVWDTNAKLDIKNPVEGQFSIALLADKTGNTVISISSYPTKVHLVTQNKDGSISFNSEELDNFAMYKWDEYADIIVAGYRSTAPQIIFPFEYIGEGSYLDVGRHRGYVFPYKGPNDGHAYGAYIMWNTGERQYTCTIRSDAKYFLFALSQISKILNSFEYYLPPSQHNSYLKEKGY